MIEWSITPFAELTVQQLYDILYLREQIFQLEQNCLYQDIDRVDLTALHVMGFVGDELAAYARIYFKNSAISIGRLVVPQHLRGQHFGKQIVRYCLDYIDREYPQQLIEVSAQYRLVNYYEALGFEAVGDVYDEDGIPHIKMIRRSGSTSPGSPAV